MYMYIYKIVEGNGDPLPYSCLDNPMDGGAWWAAVHGVAKSDMTEATPQQQQHIYNLNHFYCTPEINTL